MKKGKTKKRINLFEKHIDEQIQTLNTSTKREIQKEVDHFKDRDWKSEDQMHRKVPTLAALEFPEDHAMPKSRREFMRQGLLGTTLSLTAPSLLTSNVAQALECPAAAAGAARLPLLVIDCSAGATFMGVNIVPSTSENEINPVGNQTSYGVSNAEAAMITDILGNNSTMQFNTNSAMGTEMLATATQAVLNNVDGITVACASDDDTAGQVLNISQAVVQAGFRGSLAGAIGTRNSGSGGRADSLLANASNISTRVRNQNEAQNLVNPGNLGLGLGSNPGSVEYVLRQIASLTESQTSSIQSNKVTGEQRTAVACGAQANISNLGQKDFSNMYASPEVTGVFGNNLAQSDDDTDLAVAAGVYLALKGEVSVATVNIGGCDYHAVGAGGQVAKDREIGRAIGAAFRMASLNTEGPMPMAVLLITDGSASTGNGRGDGGLGAFNRSNTENSNYSSAHLFVYNPAEKPAIIRPQYGRFTAAGVVQGGNAPAWATSPDAAAQVMAVNYMMLAGATDQQIAMLGNLPANSANELFGFGARIIQPPT